MIPVIGGGFDVVAFHPTQDPITSEDGTTHAMGTGSKGGCATVAVAVTGEVFHTLRASDGGSGEDGTGRGAGAVAVAVDCYNGALTGEQVMAGMAVRRLTPRECERLQGFPDDYTLIPLPGAHKQPRISKNRPAERWMRREDGKWLLLAADGPRYKALGNSWAVPCARWIGRRIKEALT